MITHVIASKKIENSIGYPEIVVVGEGVEAGVAVASLDGVPSPAEFIALTL